MSGLIQLYDASSVAILHAHLVPLAGDGLLDLIEQANARTRSLARGVSITIGILFVIVAAVTSRMSMARVIIAILAAGLLIFGVYNVTDIKDRIGNDLDGQAGVRLIDAVPHPTNAI